MVDPKRQNIPSVDVNQKNVDHHWYSRVAIGRL